METAVPAVTQSALYKAALFPRCARAVLIDPRLSSTCTHCSLNTILSKPLVILCFSTSTVTVRNLRRTGVSCSVPRTAQRCWNVESATTGAALAASEPRRRSPAALNIATSFWLASSGFYGPAKGRGLPASLTAGLAARKPWVFRGCAAFGLNFHNSTSPP